MTGDEMAEMARRCTEMMRTMGAMMGMHGDSGAAEGGMPGMDGMGSMMGMGGGPGLLLLFLLVVGAAVLLGTLLIRRAVSRGAPGASAALAELDRRYALGDIDRETFLETRRDLREAWA